jgi:hypothetical protein
MGNVLTDYYRPVSELSPFGLQGELSGTEGYFRFGQKAICYGRSFKGLASRKISFPLRDLRMEVKVQNNKSFLPFDAEEVLGNFRRERYLNQRQFSSIVRGLGKNTYYLLRSVLPFGLRSRLKRLSMRNWRKIKFPGWPVDRTADEFVEQLMLLAIGTQQIEKVPFIWFWPNGRSGCVVMTHDVETSDGLNFCSPLMDLNDSYGIKSSFQIIPEGRYTAPDKLLTEIRTRGFEINVHDWNHDGLLFSDRNVFLERVAKINQFAQRHGAHGFRSGALYRNADWYDAFTFAYDMSIPNVGHLDPQPGGCCTVMPFYIGRILEIPVTTTQDYMLFHLLGEYSIDLWKRQIDLILEGYGMASFIIHPDYIIEKRARATYVSLLDYLSRLCSERNVWIARPHEVYRWWRNRSQMKVVQKGERWKIEGPDRESARLAYATSDGDRVVYTLAGDVDNPAPMSPSLSLV